MNDKEVQQLVADIDKEFGEGSIAGLGERVGKKVPCVPTGIFSVDYNVLGVGGIPRSRITEMFGSESSGKTTLSLLTIASAQRAGGRAAFVDVEHALDPNWMAKLGVNVDKLLVSQPDYGEQALSITEKLIDSCAFDVIVVDSVAALVPKSELDGEIGDSHMGLAARMMSQACRKLTPAIARSSTAVIFINQVRDKIGVVWGSPVTTTGGRALKFYASVRLDIARISSVKNGEDIVGNRVRIKAAKNKMAPPFRESEVDLLFSSGFDVYGNLLDAAVEYKVVEQKGSWFSYKGERLGQGKSNAAEAIQLGLYDKILGEVMKVREGK